MGVSAGGHCPAHDGPSHLFLLLLVEKVLGKLPGTGPRGPHGLEAWCGRGRRLLAAPRFLQGDTDSLRAEARPTHEVSTGTAPHPPQHPGPRHQSVCFLPPSTRYVSPRSNCKGVQTSPPRGSCQQHGPPLGDSSTRFTPECLVKPSSLASAITQTEVQLCHAGSVVNFHS